MRALTRVEGRAESGASEVHVHAASGAGVGDLRVVGAGHALDDGAVRAAEPAQPEEPRTHAGRGARGAVGPSSTSDQLCGGSDLLPAVTKLFKGGT